MIIDLKTYQVREHLSEPLRVSDLRAAGATPKQIKGIMKARGKALKDLAIKTYGSVKAKKEVVEGFHKRLDQRTQEFMDQGVSD